MLGQDKKMATPTTTTTTAKEKTHIPCFLQIRFKKFMPLAVKTWQMVS